MRKHRRIVRAAILLMAALSVVVGLSAGRAAARTGTTYCDSSGSEMVCIGAPSLTHGSFITGTASGRQLSFTGGTLVITAGSGDCVDFDVNSLEPVVGGCSGNGTQWTKGTSSGHTVWINNYLNNHGLEPLLCNDDIQGDVMFNANVGENNHYCRYN